MGKWEEEDEFWTVIKDFEVSPNQSIDSNGFWHEKLDKSSYLTTFHTPFWLQLVA